MGTVPAGFKKRALVAVARCLVVTAVALLKKPDADYVPLSERARLEFEAMRSAETAAELDVVDGAVGCARFPGAKVGRREVAYVTESGETAKRTLAVVEGISAEEMMAPENRADAVEFLKKISEAAGEDGYTFADADAARAAELLLRGEAMKAAREAAGAAEKGLVDAGQRLVDGLFGKESGIKVREGTQEEAEAAVAEWTGKEADEEKRMQLVGKSQNGMEIYESDPSVLKMPYRQRKRKFQELMTKQYAGRTARFTRNGQTYYAMFEESDVKKNIHGDAKSDRQGMDAKINSGASGDMFDLVENARYDHTSNETGKNIRSHKGVKSWDYFEKTVQIDGKVFDVVINVRDKGNNQFVYNVQLNRNLNVKPVRHMTPSPKATVLRSGATGSTPNSIPQSGGNGKRPSIAGRKGAEQLGLGGASDAEAMEKAGADREEIWRKTGWWRGKDGQWRVELPQIAIDEQKLKQLDINRNNYNFRKRKAQPEYHARLEDLIADKQLVAKLNAAYGTLPHISVVDDVGWALGRFHPETNSIDIHRHLTAAEMRSVLEHELQHFIQHKEGFTGGGDNTGGEYQNLTGEVEARNVQKRLAMSPEERAATPPWATEDVPGDKQIVRYSLKDAAGQVKGWFDRGTGEVVLFKGADIRTVAHEIGWHAVRQWAEKNSPELLAKMNEYAASCPKSLRRLIEKNYKGFTGEALIDEIGAGRFERELGDEFRKLLETRPQVRSWWQKVTDAIRKMLKGWGGKGNGIDLKKIEKMAPEEAMSWMAERMLEGKGLPGAEAGRQDGGKRASIGGIFTGTAADYANESRQGGKGDGPSLKKIGSGEGSQVYGWGLYGSTMRGVAEGYAKHGRSGESIAWRMLKAEGRVKAIRTLKNGLKKGYYTGNHARWIPEAIKILEEHREKPPSENVYEQTWFTNRAPGDESLLLKWYEPVSKEQFEVLRKAGLDVEEKSRTVDGETIRRVQISKDGELLLQVKATSEITGEDLYRLVAKSLGSEKAASEFLARAGIDGVKYPVDSYGGKGVKDGDKAGWNYVSFRDDNIRVDHKWTDGERRYSIATRAYNPEAQVKVVDGTVEPEFKNLTTAEIRNYIHDKYMGREVTIESDGTLVVFTKRGLKDAMKKRGEHRRALHALDALVKTSHYTRFEENDGKKKHEDLIGQFVYTAALRLGDGVYAVEIKLDVPKSDPDKTRFKGQTLKTKIADAVLSARRADEGVEHASTDEASATETIRLGDVATAVQSISQSGAEGKGEIRPSIGGEEFLDGVEQDPYETPKNADDLERLRRKRSDGGRERNAQEDAEDRRRSAEIALGRLMHGKLQAIEPLNPGAEEQGAPAQNAAADVEAGILDPDRTPSNDPSRTYPIAMGMSELVRMYRAMSGGAMPKVLAKGLRGERHGRWRNGKTWLAADVFGIVDKSDMAAIRDELKKDFHGDSPRRFYGQDVRCPSAPPGWRLSQSVAVMRVAWSHLSRGTGALARHDPTPTTTSPPINRRKKVVPCLWTVGGRAMSSALWLPPPPASVPNALLAQEGVSHALSGRYRKVPRKNRRRLGGTPRPTSRSFLTVCTISLDGVGVLPSRRVWVPLTRGFGFPHGDFDSPCRASVLPCGGWRPPLYRGLSSPVPGFGFPCTGVWVPLYGRQGVSLSTDKMSVVPVPPNGQDVRCPSAPQRTRCPLSQCASTDKMSVVPVTPPRWRLSLSAAARRDASPHLAEFPDCMHDLP